MSAAALGTRAGSALARQSRVPGDGGAFQRFPRPALTVSPGVA